MDIKGQSGWSGASERVMGEWVVGQWIVGVISFQKTFGLCGIKGHIVAKRKDVLDGHGRTESEDRARIQDSEFATKTSKM